MTKRGRAKRLTTTGNCLLLPHTQYDITNKNNNVKDQHYQAWSNTHQYAQHLGKHGCNQERISSNQEQPEPACNRSIVQDPCFLLIKDKNQSTASILSLSNLDVHKSHAP